MPNKQLKLNSTEEKFCEYVRNSTEYMVIYLLSDPDTKDKIREDIKRSAKITFSNHEEIQNILSYIN